MFSRFVSGRALCASILGLMACAALADDVSDGLESADPLARAKARGVFTACADPYDFPYSLQNGDPPGFDVEIVRTIAKNAGMRLEMFWINTASRGGTSRAFRQSILAKKCDVFLGLSDNGDDDMLMGKLVFSKPYIGMGYVLVTQGKAKGMTALEQFKDGTMRVGVAMSTPIDDHLFMNKIPRELYLDNRRIIEALNKGEIDAGMMWSTSLGVVKAEYPKSQFSLVDGYVPADGQRFNGTWAMRREDKSLHKFINDGLEALLESGRIKAIVESYGVPFYPPFSS
jgi:ABC-type amino acid transport substrate-binding protein